LATHAPRREAGVRVKAFRRAPPQLFRFPDGVLRDFRKLSAEVVREEADKSPMAKKVNEHYEKFKKEWLAYSDLSERAYYNMMFV